MEEKEFIFKNIIYLYSLYKEFIFSIPEWGTLRFWGSRMIINSDLESSHDADYEYAI